MSPKLHRRTPPSAHTYRLLIFKELQNSLAFALLFVARKSFCLQQQRSGIMCCFSIFVKHLCLTFFASPHFRIARFVSSKEAGLCGVWWIWSSIASTLFPLCAADESFCPSSTEPKIMEHFHLLVNYSRQKYWQLSSRPTGKILRVSDAFTQER